MHEKITKHIVKRFKEKLIVPWNTLDSCNIQQNTGMLQTTHIFGISIIFCITSLRILNNRDLQKQSTTTPFFFLRGGIYKNARDKISEESSCVKIEYVYQLYKIADQKDITLLNTTINALYICQEILWPLEVTESVERFVITDEWRVCAALSCSWPCFLWCAGPFSDLICGECVDPLGILLMCK